ncbi:MAG TPA: O-antigen ligase family protein [Puia sp.]|nr:O-antigen ligase family protein [Puia sp.]
MNTATGFIIAGLLAIGCAFCTALVDLKIGLAYLGIFVVIFVIALYLRNPRAGLYVTIAFSAIPALLSRLTPGADFPYGSITDGLAYLLFFSVIIKYSYRAQIDKRFFFNPVSIGLLILLVYYVLEVTNPNMFSKLGWFSYTRKYVLQLCFFFSCYCLFDSWKRVRFFIYFWIILTTILAAYACKQQWFGLADFEWQWLNSHPKQMDLYLQWGLLRKFSILSDPAASGVYFASVASQCIILVIREKRFRLRFWLGIAAMINLFAYAYSGTRTATLMVVAGIAFYMLATIRERRTLVFAFLCVIGFLTLMYMPFSPPAIGRIRSTFTMGSKDASATIRDVNRHTVQPYLYQHPMGGGIFTCISEGTKYNPGHYLEKFPPDGGYMKVFAEQGYIGLAIMIFCYFLFLRHGIRNYFRLSDSEMQMHAIGLLVLIFTLMVGQYSQICIGIDPETFYYFGALVFFVKMPVLEERKMNEVPLTKNNI